MTRAVVFLAAAMVAASSGVVARDASGGGGTNSAPQSNIDNNAQVTVQQPTSPGPSASASAAASTSQDSVRSSSASDSGRSSQNVAQGDETPATSNGQLPQTSTILPLLGLIGLGSLVAGFFARH